MRGAYLIFLVLLAPMASSVAPVTVTHGACGGDAPTISDCWFEAYLPPGIISICGFFACTPGTNALMASGDPSFDGVIDAGIYSCGWQPFCFFGWPVAGYECHLAAGVGVCIPVWFTTLDFALVEGSVAVWAGVREGTGAWQVSLEGTPIVNV